MKRFKIILLLIVLTVLFVRCQKYGEYNENNYILNKGSLNADSIIRINSITSTTLLADSFANTTIVVGINNRASSSGDSNVIKLSTNQGSFANNHDTMSLRANSNGQATFILSSGTLPGTALIQASVLNYSITQNLQFAQTNPDSILISTPDTTGPTISVSAKADSLPINVQLKCFTGFPSRDIYCYFSADSNGSTNSFGRFTGNFYSSASGNVKACFYPQKTTFRGIAKINVSIISGTFSKSATLLVKITP